MYHMKENKNYIIIFAQQKGSFPLKETLRLREQRFYGSAVADWKEYPSGRSFFMLFFHTPYRIFANNILKFQIL